MAKLILTDIENLTNEATAVSSMASNNDAIEAALENTLSRDGTSPNQMNADLDMNSKRIYNLPEPVDNQEPLRLGDMTSGENQLGIATQEEAEAGTSNATLMTPLRVENRIDSQFEDTSTDNAVVKFDGSAGKTQNSGVTIDDSNGIHANGLALNSSSTINWGDAFLRRDAADTLSMYQGSNAQTFNIYGTRTDASNYERLNIGFNTGNSRFKVGSQKNGTGAARSLQLESTSDLFFSVNEVDRWKITPHFTAASDNVYDIGASSDLRPRNIYAATDVVAANNVTALSKFTFGTSGAQISSGLNGSTMLITNKDGNSFSRLMFGGSTSSYPSLEISGTTLRAVLADSSAHTNSQAKQLQVAGDTSGLTTLAAQPVASGTLTLPAATDTLVGKATTDTFTNKTFDTAGTGNSFKINGTAVTDKTGTGNVVLATSPSLTTPNIGAATGTSLSLTSGLTAMNATAVPAGGSSSVYAFKFTTNAIGLYVGTNAPSFSAPRGSIYIRENGSGSNNRMYIATDSSGTWTNFTTAA